MYLNIESPPPSAAKKSDPELRHSKKSKARTLSPDVSSQAPDQSAVVKDLFYTLSTPVSLPSESLDSTEDFLYAELIVNDRGEECLSRALLRLFLTRFNQRDPSIMQVFSPSCVFETRASQLTPAFTAVSMLAEAVSVFDVAWGLVTYDKDKKLLTGQGAYQRSDGSGGQFQILCRLLGDQFDYIHLLL